MSTDKKSSDIAFTPVGEGKSAEETSPAGGNTESRWGGGMMDVFAGMDPGRYGTLQSFILVIVAIVLSILVFKYGPDIDSDSFDNYCSNSDYEDSCKANSAVLRVSLALTCMFAIQIIGTYIFTPFFDNLWIPKYFIFFAFVLGFFYVDGKHFGTDGYAWFARITGFFYLILQQVILLDMAYSWNERWLAYSAEDGERGYRWLVGIVVFSVILFAGAYLVIALLFWQFKGCDNNLIIISLALGLSVIATIIQLFFSEEGSLLTSAVMTAYVAYVCYSAVILNPDDSCNPTLNSGYQTLSAIIGIILTVISLLWTAYNTVHNIPQVTDRQTGSNLKLSNVANPGEASNNPSLSAAPSVSPFEAYNNGTLNSLLVQVSGVFLLVSGYYAMVLTNWATEQSNSSIETPRTGTATMWIQAAGIWIAIVIYIWSLFAPTLFPNREF